MLYPVDSGLPKIFDCYALNVDGETVHCCPYRDFHVISVARGMATDLGAAPVRHANRLLIRGRDGALIGGAGPDYDLVTPLRLDRDGVHAAASQCRLVLPDGTEVQGMRRTCRGAELHAFRHQTWYRTALDDVLAAAAVNR